jgi:hypothetical protein
LNDADKAFLADLETTRRTLIHLRDHYAALNKIAPPLPFKERDQRALGDAVAVIISEISDRYERERFLTRKYGD